MIALVCVVRGTTKHGWVQVSAVIPPSEVSQWRGRFRADDEIRAMWQLVGEVIEATGGRKHRVSPFGNAIQLTRKRKHGLTEREILIPTSGRPEVGRLVLDVSDGVAVQPPSVGGRA